MHYLGDCLTSKAPLGITSPDVAKKWTGFEQDYWECIDLFTGNFGMFLKKVNPFTTSIHTALPFLCSSTTTVYSSLMWWPANQTWQSRSWRMNFSRELAGRALAGSTCQLPPSSFQSCFSNGPCGFRGRSDTSPHSYDVFLSWNYRTIA